MASALAARGDEFAQNLGATAQAGWRVRIGHDRLGPLPRRAHLAPPPSRKRQQLAITVPEGAPRRRQRLERGAHVAVGSGVDLRVAGRQRDEILYALPDAPVAGDSVIGGN